MRSQFASRDDLLCVRWDVKPTNSLTPHSLLTHAAKWTFAKFCILPANELTKQVKISHYTMKAVETHI